MPEDESNSKSRPMDRQTTGEDRVRMTARQLSEPRTANWIASEAGWSHEPTKRVLERLVDDGILHRDESGTHTTYYPDYRRQVMQEAMRLRDSEHTVEELTDHLAEMRHKSGTGRMSSMSKHRINFAERSPTMPLMPRRKTVAIRSHASGSTSSAVSKSLGLSSVNGIFWPRRPSPLRPAADYVACYDLSRKAASSCSRMNSRRTRRDLESER